MARKKAAKSAAAVPRLPVVGGADTFEAVLLGVMLVLIPIRTFVSESHDFATAAWFRNISPQSSAQPGHTFLFIAVIAICATCVAILRRIRGTGWQTTGLLPGGALLVIAAGISTLRAGQKHLAIIGSIDFLAMLLYCATLRQLLSRSWQHRLALAVVLACGGAVVVKCGTQKWVELPATVKLFEEQYRAAMANGQEDPGRLYDFEQRLKSGAVTGYFSHANVLAGYLILIVMAGIGVAWARVKARRSAVAPAIIAILGYVTIVFTQSKGAAAAAAGAMGLWGVGRLIRSRGGLSARLSPIRAAMAVWMGMTALGVAVVALLWRNPEALGRSILFRWLYWQGAADMLRGEGWLGVGANNFGRFFTRYKPVICPEDVQDPHSWIVRSLTEWGALGLIAVVAAWIGWTRVTARHWSGLANNDGVDSGIEQTVSKEQVSERFRGIGGWALALTLSTGVVWTVISWGGAAGLWEQTVLIGAACWLAFFLLISIESRQEREYSSLGGLVDPWALVAGLVAFLIHASIDLELFWAGPATVFMAIAAIAQASSRSSVATRNATPESVPSPTTPRHALRTCLVILAVGIFGTLFLPLRLSIGALRLGAGLDRARTSPRPDGWQAYQLSPSNDAYRAAAEAYSLDATAIDERTLELVARIEATAHCDSVMEMLAEWRRRDPDNGAIDQRASMVMTRRYQITGNAADLDAAIAHMEAAVTDSPAAPQRRVALGQLYDLKGPTDPVAGEKAAAAYEAAIDLDERRTLVSAPNRMNPALRAHLEERITALRGRTP